MFHKLPFPICLPYRFTLKTYFKTDVPYDSFLMNATTVTPNVLWKEAGTNNMIPDTAGGVLYNEGCIYIYYKQTGGSSSIYEMTGDYKIVIIN